VYASDMLVAFLSLFGHFVYYIVVWRHFVYDFKIISFVVFYIMIASMNFIISCDFSSSHVFFFFSSARQKGSISHRSKTIESAHESPRPTLNTSSSSSVSLADASVPSKPPHALRASTSSTTTNLEVRWGSKEGKTETTEQQPNFAMSSGGVSASPPIGHCSSDSSAGVVHEGRGEREGSAQPSSSSSSLVASTGTTTPPTTSLSHATIVQAMTSHKRRPIRRSNTLDQSQQQSGPPQGNALVAYQERV
jgi:hypothetical protein